MTISSVEVIPFKVRELSNYQCLRHCLFLDRDGVVNRSPGSGYVTSSEDFALNEGIGELLQSAHSFGWLVIIVSSQRCVSKGLITTKDLASIHESMQASLDDRYGSNFDGIYIYTGEPGTEDWEKPRPGMIEQACKDHAINPATSLLVGDQDRDIEMAQNAGIGRTVRVLNAEEQRPNHVIADLTVGSIPEMVVAVKQCMESRDVITNQPNDHSS
ncbi:MAG: HAD-IIIA family hydrolase [Verrucomicrobiaceae bacterium]|nr:HAD-IIIA family hydrolase [Verrucomicrobiaceae bacterium]